MTAEPPSRHPTMRDVAARAGVSRQLVSLVLRDAPGPSAASRELILDAAAELGFRPSAAARLLRQERTRLIGVIFTAQNPFEARFVERLLEEAPTAGFGVVLGPLTSRRSTDLVVGELLSHRVEALMCFSPDSSSPTLKRAIATLPVVWLGERAADDRADVVRPDDEEGMRLIVRHLVSSGHRRIAYAGGLQGRAGPGRAAAYRAAMREVGLGSEIDELVVGFDEEEGARAARQLLARPVLPTAIAACSDQCAVGILGTLSAHNVHVPQEVSVTGYDDSPVAAFSYIGLTTVRQDMDATVEAALDAVTRRRLDPAHPPTAVATSATLMLRATTGPPRP